MRARLTAALLLCGLTQAAYAAHPLVTDDTGTQDTGNSQLEVNADRARYGDATRRTTSAVTYTYGALRNLDVFFNVPMALSSPSGAGDVSIGMKWRFAEGDNSSVAFKPELLLPSGDENKALGTGKAGFGLTLIGNWEAAPWTLQGNVALTFNNYKLQADRDANRTALWRVSAAARYALNEQWQLLGDLGVSRNNEVSSNSHPAYFLTGVIYSPMKTLDLDAGIRFGLGCSECTAQIDRQFGLGLTWRF
ncbi:transporter [Noviherbaspirillum cavernae]|uniref:Transporter n=1 Tax=Noviherbaspirillum cavernae TaxID=2320862 RepID=A0A418X6P7_9BURK|nr:transporter [Noviherbaspirillum cavernae]RJG08125.1 transporter [Noviherbaspirillum cavernae]